MELALRVTRTAPSATEQSLVAAVRAGSDGAFEELFARYRDRISAYVHGAVGDHARAEDVTQEVFISALRRMRDTERPIAFKPWIYEIARNACIDEYRRNRRTSEVSLSGDGESGGPELRLPSSDPPPDVVVEERQKLNHLQGAFGGLSENHHRILVMRELEGLSYGEIGKQLGMSRAMVESTLFRARKRLNQEFRELESGQRCERVRAAVDRSALASARMLGVRERRQVARHMAYCQQCRQYAWTAGFDASSLKRRSAAQRIAALLPIGWWRAHAGGAKQAMQGPSSAAAKMTARLARYSEPVSQVGLGRAVAATAAIAFVAAGGSYVVSGSPTHRTIAARPAAVTLAAPPAHATAVFLHAARTTAPQTRAPARAGKPGAGRHHHHAAGRGRPGHRSGSGPAGRAPGAPAAPRAASSTTRGAAVSSSSGGGQATTSSHSSSRGLLSSLLSGGGSSSTSANVPQLPHLPSAPSLSSAAANLAAPAQGAVNAVTQAANAAKQVVDTAAQTVGSMGDTASNLVGGVSGLGGSGSGGG